MRVYIPYIHIPYINFTKIKLLHDFGLWSVLTRNNTRVTPNEQQQRVKTQRCD